MKPDHVYVLTIYDTTAQRVQTYTLCGMHAEPLAEEAMSVRDATDDEHHCVMCRQRKSAVVLPFRSALMLCMAQHPAGKGRP